MKWIKNKDAIMSNKASLCQKTRKRTSHSRIQCRVQSNNDLRLENELHQRLLIHFGRGVRITQSIVQSCAEKLKKDFPTSSNLGRRWVETFITKKGYTYKRIRGSKGLIPNADIELCRNEIRQKTKKYSPANCVNIDETGHNPYCGENYSYQIDEGWFSKKTR